MTLEVDEGRHGQGDDERGGARHRAASAVRVLRPRTLSLGAGLVLVVLLTALAALLPVPYVILSPGPTANTLGTDGDDGDVIQVSGRDTYPTEGHLQLLTVSVSGGPGAKTDLLSAVRAWFDGDAAVVPEEQVYPDDPSREEIRERNAEEMQLSQNSATTAALTELGIPIQRDVVVRSVSEGAPAQGVLKAGDVIKSVAGVATPDPQAVRDVIQAQEPGEPVRVTVLRAGEQQDLAVPTEDNGEGLAQVGIVPDVKQTYPFQVQIRLQDVGGPSAGMMFTLGIIDKLTPGPLTGGAFVAGTGTITDDGDVGPIGGIKQKLAGAKDAGATVFLAPEENCGETRGSVPDGLQVVRVGTLDDALTALDAVREQRTADLPAC